MNVYWLEQVEANVANERNWLSAHENACLNDFRFPKRRADWLLGRWTAKQALASYLSLPADSRWLATFELRPAASGAPEAFVENQPANLTVSLSHRAGKALCAIAPSGVKLGCDLELVEPRSDAFVADYFTVGEQQLLAQTSGSDRLRLITLVWSAKESALKALREGLRVATRTVVVSPSMELSPRAWTKLQVRYQDTRIFDGWWRYAENMVRTIISDPSPTSPLGLALSAAALEGTANPGEIRLAPRGGAASARLPGYSR